MKITSSIKSRFLCMLLILPVMISQLLFGGCSDAATKPPDGKAFKVMEAAGDEGVAAFEESFIKSNGNIAAGMGDMVKLLKSRTGVVKDCSILPDESGVWTIYKNGVQEIFLARLPSSPGGPTAKDREDMKRLLAGKDFSNRSSSNYGSSGKKAVMLSPFAWRFGPWADWKLDTIRSGLEQADFAVDFKSNSQYYDQNVSLENFKKLDNYSLVYIDTVAALSGGGDIILVSGQKSTYGSSLPYSSDFLSGNLVRVRIRGCPGTYIGLSPGFISASSVVFPSSLVFISASGSAANDTLEKAFTGKGAYAFGGWDRPVHPKEASWSECLLFNYMADKNQNLKEALAGVTAQGYGRDPETGAVLKILPDGGGDFSMFSAPTPFIRAFVPGSGIPGDEIEIIGDNFSGASKVTFYNDIKANFEVINDNKIKAVIPEGASNGPVSVTIPNSAYEGDQSLHMLYAPEEPVTLTGSSKNLAFTISLRPSITAMDPVEGSPGTEVTIKGSHFKGAGRVSFNKTPAKFQVLDDLLIAAEVPPGASSGQVIIGSLRGSSNGAGFTVNASQPPAISTVEPPGADPGDTVVISGNNFTGTDSVEFGGVNTHFNIISDSEIEAIVPPGPTSGQVMVITPAGSSNGFDFRVVRTPAIISIEPEGGSRKAAVLIKGVNFTGAGKVTFNGKEAKFEILGDGVIKAAVPETASTGTVKVSSGPGDSNGMMFTVVSAPPEITSITPSSAGPGDEVLIAGNNFYTVKAAVFNGVNARFAVLDNNNIRAEIPAHASTGPVVITSPEGPSNKAGFTVTPVSGPPVIKSLSSPCGRGGDTVVITGKKLIGAAEVKFNGIKARFDVVSDDRIDAVVPGHATTGPVSVTAPNGTSNGINFAVEKWSFKTGGEIRYSSAAIDDNGTIYFGSCDQNLYALNPDGSKKWAFKTGGMVTSSPAIDDNGTIYFGSWDNNVYALNPDGAMKWKYKTGGYIHSSAALGHDGTVYFGSNDKHLYALNPDGTFKWRYFAGFGVYSPPSVGSDGTIYSGKAYDMIFALHPDGKLKWNYVSTCRIDGNPAIGPDGTVYIGSNDFNLYALDPDNGSVKWYYITKRYVYSSPVVGTDGSVYVGSNDGHLYALNPDGTFKWKYASANDIRSSPALCSDGTVYIGSDDHNIYAVNPGGTLKWKYTTGKDIWSSPSIGPDGTVYIGSLDGKLHAIYGDGKLADSPWPMFRKNLKHTSLTPCINPPMAGGIWHTLLLMKDGTVGAWGNNLHGQVGDGTMEHRSRMVRVKGLTGVRQVSAGSYHSMALKKDGTVWTWGKNEQGQLGNGTYVDSSLPVMVTGLSGITAVSAGGNHCIALKKDGTVWTWGANEFGQLGDGANVNRNTPIMVKGIRNAISISAGYGHCYVLRSDETAWSWGEGDHGELASGKKDNESHPVRIPLKNVVLLRSGGHHGLALLEDGSFWTWGMNCAGQIGNCLGGKGFDYENVDLPVKLPISGVVNMAGGYEFTLALKKDGVVWSWGMNRNGELGIGKNILLNNRPIKTEMKDVMSIAAGGHHGLAITKDGSLWEWGSNDNGQIGDGTLEKRYSPVKIPGYKYKY
ncbi:MAG: PQQ-binding-like beta-propeller repeat protein [Chloroflexi bacterium]|nr:PQQ-binding-like beta-propeller repeat protein [Chloroflexota bacterium]